MGKIATTTFDRHGSTWDVRLKQKSATASLALKITALTRTQGSRSGAILSPILPSRVRLRVRDPAGAILDRIESNPLRHFEIEIDRGGSRWHEGFLIKSSLGDAIPSDPKLTLRFDDRIRRLGKPDQHFRPDGAGDSSADFRPKYVPSGSVFHTLDRVPAAVLHTVTDLPVRTYFNYTSTKMGSGSPLRFQRMRANDLMRDRHPPRRQAALSRFCSVFGLQAVQHDGKFWLLERAMRGQNSSYGERQTTGNLTGGSTGSDTRTIALSDSDIRTKEQLTPEVRRQKYTEVRVGRYRADTNLNLNPTGLGGATGPKADVWNYNVGSIGTLFVTLADTGDTLKRVYPWERPDESIEDMTVTVNIEVDVFAGASFPNGNITFQIGRLFETDLSGAQSTQSIGVAVNDNNSGTINTVSVTKSFDIDDDHEARIQFEHEQDPDGDGIDEIGDLRIDVSALYSDPVSERQPVFNETLGFDNPKDVTTVMGEGSFDYGTRDREFSMAGVIGVQTGSGWRRLFRPHEWDHPTLSSSSFELLAASAGVQTNMLTPTEDPLLGWTLRQDIGAPGSITHAFTYRGLTHVPIHVRTDVLKGTRELTMYELRT